MPEVGSSRPRRIDSVVVLPAPLPPSSAAVTPGIDGKVDAVYRDGGAVPLDEIFYQDDGFGHRPYMAPERDNSHAITTNRTVAFRAAGPGIDIARSASGAGQPRSPPVSLVHQSASAERRHGFDRISVRRLVLIRWVAIAGQARDAAVRA